MNTRILNLKPLNKNLLLIGFQGSKPKHLKLYKNMYKELGFKNIDIVCPNYLENYDVRKVQPLAKNIYNQIIDKESTVIHCMSGAMYPLSYTIKYLLWKQELNRVDSLILDSAPVLPSHESLINAFTKHNNIKYSKQLVDLSFRLYYRFIFLEMETWANDFNFLMNAKQFNTPKLFIHSKNDMIAPVDYINSIIHNHIKYGNVTEQLLLEDSPHVRHICSNPILYKQKISDFIFRNIEPT